MIDSKTIAAVATPKGHGALSIVRLSGNTTSEVLSKCFDSKGFKNKESHKAYFGAFKDSKSGDVIDEVLVLYFKDGRGFTGEEAADVICHGGTMVTQMVLQSVLDAGARQANPGEFTLRAVLNGKMDLAQAEAVLELIEAKSKFRVSQAVHNIKGALSQTLEKIDAEVVYLLAQLEASIDFSTEDIEVINNQDLLNRVDKAKKEIEELVKGYELTKIYQDGVRIALIGTPNVGKSSLLNKIIGRDRSIVTEKAGTTRDVVEVPFTLGQVPVLLSDTAGLRDTDDDVEKIGVQKSKEQMNQADLILFVLDSSRDINNEEKSEIESLKNKNVIFCLNKDDKTSEQFRAQWEMLGVHSKKVILSNTVSDSGVKNLTDKIVEVIQPINDSETQTLVSSERQKISLDKVHNYLSTAREKVFSNASPDLCAFDLRCALEELRSLSGKELKDDVLDKVFKEFCIGK